MRRKGFTLVELLVVIAIIDHQNYQHLGAKADGQTTYE